ncbi:MAG: serine hydroxymethyltransferase, partial [Spirochaetales bacterium]|nr:serine hydroxymethyltransferase [Spirochaetales bacterium]
QEEARQSGVIRLIPSENYVSQAVRMATGSCLTNKYAEGYPGKRYYEGQQVTDLIEDVARNRAKKIFKADHANVQPYSGSIANLGAYNSLIKPGQKIMGLTLSSGGHLTHGSKVSITSKFFEAVNYSVKEDGYLDYDAIRELAKKERPDVIVSGTTAYPRAIDFEIFGDIAKEVGAYHVSDIAHLSGLVVAGLHKSPVPYADIVSTTTHKTLRGPRGGMLLCKEEHAKKVDKAIMPGQQGGPHMHTIAAIAVALEEADSQEFLIYAEQILKNSKRLSEKLMEKGFDLVTGGTDNHIILVDLRSKNIPGRDFAKALDRAKIVGNFNTIPHDPAPATKPNGLRIGTPAVTTRGMKEAEMDIIADLINKVAENMGNEEKISEVAKEVMELTSRFPVPAHFVVPKKKITPFGCDE